MPDPRPGALSAATSTPAAASESPAVAATGAHSLEPGTPGGQPPSGQEREFTIKARTQRQLIVRRFLQHRAATVSLVIFVLLVLIALVGGAIWHYKYADISNDFSQPPSVKHPMGTDEIGHDVLAQILRGAQKSVEIALLVAFVSTAVGTVVGSVSGYFRGGTDALLMRLVDLILTIPSIVILITLSAQAAGSANSWILISLIIAGLLWAPISRTVRGQFLSLREKEYVEAAKAVGASNRRIIFRHLLPNALGPIIVAATIAVAVAILTESALSYLGVGIRPPDTSLGQLVSNGQQAASTRPWLFYFPGLYIIFIALSVNFIGDGLRDAFDPQQNRVRA